MAEFYNPLFLLTLCAFSYRRVRQCPSRFTENIEKVFHFRYNCVALGMATHKKKWTEYLLEFFMLFLAVFLGFIAENLREDIAEHNRAKHYANSLYYDMIQDSMKLNEAVNICS